MNHDVFISYSSIDMEAAQAICHVLEQSEVRCWMAPRNIPPGSDYGDVIDDAIRSCKVVVIVYSENAASSPWVKGELNVAFEEQKTIIPFRLDKTPLKGQARVMLNQRHWIDAYPDYKIKFNDLVKAVAQAVGKDVQLVLPPVKSSLQVVKCKKPIIFGIIAAIFIILLFPLFTKIVQHFHNFVYDKNGLHVNIKGLSSQQEDALLTILDNMILVEGGVYCMGNNYSREEYLTKLDSISSNPHKVKLSTFYISKYELTQKQWIAFSKISDKCIEYNENKAVEKLSWEEAKLFADSLANITGLHFSLPTESQWEYAAKGGKKSKGFLYSGFDENPSLFAWYYPDNLESAEEVGKKMPNELKLYDMTGNVSEWCLDFYAEYPKNYKVDPTGPIEGFDRIYRGGDYTMPNLPDMKTSTRYFTSPFIARKATGMRLVINLK